MNFMSKTFDYSPTIISFYCDVDGSAFYSNCAKWLSAVCDQLETPYYIVKRCYGSSWIDNVRAKPEFILETLDRLVGDCIWLDVDSLLLQRPNFKLDKWAVMLRKDTSPHDFVHYIPNNNASRLFLRKWIDEIKRAKRGSHTAFISIAKDYQILPDDYFQIGLAESNSKTAYLTLYS